MRKVFFGAICFFSGYSVQVSAQAVEGEKFRVWVFADAHVGTDIEQGVESLAEAIRQSEQGLEGNHQAPPMDWDIGICLGDFAGGFEAPEDPEGAEVVRQFAALTNHTREQLYCIAGNHDATTHEDDVTQWWFRKWIDPTGENTAYSGVDASQRPYPITGSWERYSFRVGNVLFLMMSDRNDLPPPVGRGPIDDTINRGGYPAGAVTSETFTWWQQQVEDNPDAIIVSGHHHMLKDTTTASGEWGGFTTREDGSRRPLYHGYNSSGAPIGASYLYFLDDKPDAQAFEQYLNTHNQAIDVWLGAHTHLSPAHRGDDRGYIEQKWGTTFINAAALSKYHNPLIVPPSSRLLTFTEGSDELRVQYYLHSNDYYYPGWYAEGEARVKLGKAFHNKTGNR